MVARGDCRVGSIAGCRL